MLISSVSTLSVAYAVIPPHITDVQNEIEKAGEYILNKTDAKNPLSYSDYLAVLKSGAEMSSYKDPYVVELKANLDKNGGKILVEQTDYDENWNPIVTEKEDLGVYGAVIQTLRLYGYDPTDFEGYNIVDALLSYDLSELENPYAYRTAVEAVDGVTQKELTDDMISRFYSLGNGMENWGYSCDNAAHFLAAVEGQEIIDNTHWMYVDDAADVVRSYIREDGAYCDKEYVTETNADSTALAMMAFSVTKNLEEAYWCHEKLMAFHNSETGAFQRESYYTGEIEDNLLSTKNALLGLEYYYDAIKGGACIWNEGEVIRDETCTRAGLAKYTCLICGKTKTKLIDPHHTLTLVPAKAATETATGNNEYYKCEGCEKCFKDEKAKQETTIEAETIAKLTPAVPAATPAVPANEKTAPVTTVALKKVTVKKSAKKLVLQATVKVDGKAVSGKKVTFKFNGKKYTAKTNAKGVAKVTIKKAALKKLKKGKKVTYSATYNKKTVKKTVKVK